ncbi:unnamed protein product [Calicophoron daubneyi]|uniref:Uncharacterized protein n=1 Tax=Calicophoron daubneyi TaxID=300641 RepID=A0AAV2TRK0_CALDB
MHIPDDYRLPSGPLTASALSTYPRVFTLWRTRQKLSAVITLGIFGGLQYIHAATFVCLMPVNPTYLIAVASGRLEGRNLQTHSQ